jgi:hypothetical protein
MKQVLPSARTPSEKLKAFRAAFAAMRPSVESPLVTEARTTLAQLQQGLPPTARLENLGCHGRFCAAQLTYASIEDLRKHLEPKGPAMRAFRAFKNAKIMTIHVPPGTGTAPGGPPVPPAAAAPPSDVRLKGDTQPPAPPAIAVVETQAEATPAPTGATCNWLASHNSDAITARHSYHLSPALCRGFLFNGTPPLPDGGVGTSFHPDDGEPWEALQMSPFAPGPNTLGNTANSLGLEGFQTNTMVCPVPYELDYPLAPSQICATVDFNMAPKSDQTLTCQIRAIGTGHLDSDYLYTQERFSPQITVPRSMSKIIVDPIMNTIVTDPIVEEIDAANLQYFELDPSSPNLEVMSYELICQGFDVSDQLLRYRFDFDLVDYEKAGWNN